MDPDPAEAARLYRQGCDGGDAGGCTNLGYLYEQGIGMDPDPAEAAGSTARAATAATGGLHQPRDSPAGHRHGPGSRRAARLYRQGCEMGLEFACSWADERNRTGFARPVQKNACSPVCARPRIRAWTSWVPS